MIFGAAAMMLSNMLWIMQTCFANDYIENDSNRASSFLNAQLNVYLLSKTVSEVIPEKFKTSGILHSSKPSKLESSFHQCGDFQKKKLHSKKVLAEKWKIWLNFVDSLYTWKGAQLVLKECCFRVVGRGIASWRDSATLRIDLLSPTQMYMRARGDEENWLLYSGASLGRRRRLVAARKPHAFWRITRTRVHSSADWIRPLHLHSKKGSQSPGEPYSLSGPFQCTRRALQSRNSHQCL